jgi:chromosome segregation ATPase
VQNSKANSHLRSLLSSLNVSERKQVEELLREVRTESERTERLKGQLEQGEKEVRSLTDCVGRLQEELGRQRGLVEGLRRENLGLEKERDSLSDHLMDSERSEARLRI